jgi:hypothetical protein
LAGFNENGLISDAIIAEAFLEAYLRSEDSVLSDDRAENLALYGFFPIWRYVPPWNWGKDAKVKDFIYGLANAKGLRIEWQDFPSGYAMVDIWVGEAFVVIQLGPGLLGLSLILPGDADFDVRPDEMFEDFEAFETALAGCIR